MAGILNIRTRMTTWTILLQTLTGLTLVTVLLPFVHNSFWVFRVFEYPRFQKLVACALLLAAWVVRGAWHEPAAIAFMVALTLSICYLVYKVFPYTAWSRPEMLPAIPAASTTGIRIFSANVWQDNTNHEGFVRLIEQADPDIVLLLETDRNWEAGMASLEKRYPHTEKMALDNTYGMLFYSRLPVRKSTIKFLVESDVPSLHAVIELPNGQPVQIWGLHPKPPMPAEDTRSDAKDKELMKVAFRARDCDLPVIVLGDLNDVAWSHTTELFRKTSRLLDPRRGRGFYSTFSARHWWLKFPLDYIFASTHFSLVRMKRLQPTGSDHYPIFIELQFSNAAVSQQEAPEADAGELQEAAETASKAVPAH
jgi:endonuclease/exonuclease/phosphatase (EEP) superfamily protein YafD